MSSGADSAGADSADPADADADADPDIPGFIFERELQEYRADPSMYKSRHSPAFVKLVAVDEARRQEQLALAQAVSRRARPELLSMEELRDHVQEALSGLKPSEAEPDYHQALERGVAELVAACQPAKSRAAKVEQARIALMDFSRRSVKAS